MQEYVLGAFIAFRRKRRICQVAKSEYEIVTYSLRVFECVDYTV